MRVPPQRRGLPVAWLLRGLLLVGFVTLGGLAIATQQASPAQPVVAAATEIPPTAVPSPTVAPPPTQTPQPITSIIVRQTLVPFPTATPLPPNQVSVVDFSYMPGIVRIASGQSVTWRNDGTEQHDVTGSDWHSGPMDPGYTYRLTFGIPGTYPYRCSIHLDMTGSVIVT
jgi:hypothetical protein